MEHAWPCGLCSPQQQGEARQLSEGEALHWAIRADWAPQPAQWPGQAFAAQGASMAVPSSAPPVLRGTAAAWGGTPPPPPLGLAVEVIAAQAEAAELRLALQQALDSEAAASSRALGAELHAAGLERQVLQGQGNAAALETALASAQQHLAVAQQQAALQAAAEHRAQRLEAELERVTADRAAVQRQAETARAEAAAAAQQLRDAQEQAKRAGECSRLVVEHAARQAEERGRLEEGARRLEALLAAKEREAQQAAEVQREQARTIQELQVGVIADAHGYSMPRKERRWWVCLEAQRTRRCPQPTSNRWRPPPATACRTACASRVSTWPPARRAAAVLWTKPGKPRWDGTVNGARAGLGWLGFGPRPALVENTALPEHSRQAAFLC